MGIKSVTELEIMVELDTNEPEWYITYATQKQLADLYKNRCSLVEHRARVIRLYWVFARSTWSAIAKQNQ